jgi:hypothetical protein
MVILLLGKEKWTCVDPRSKDDQPDSYDHPLPLYQHSAVVIGHYMYVYGGLTNFLKTVYMILI